MTYANCVKERLLGVPHETLVTYGAVSEQTARAMAEGIVRESGADIGVGITGIAARTAAQKKSRWALCTLR